MAYEREYFRVSKALLEPNVEKRRIGNDLPRFVAGVTSRYLDQRSPILEIGADTGYYKDYIHLPDNGMYVSSDINRGALIRGRRDRQLDAVQADAQALPFKDGSFGFVIAADVYDIVSDPEDAFAESARVLKGRGKLIVFGANHPVEHIYDVNFPKTSLPRVIHYIEMLRHLSAKYGLSINEYGIIGAVQAQTRLERPQTQNQLERAMAAFNPELYARERQLKEDSTMLLFVATKASE